MQLGDPYIVGVHFAVAIVVVKTRNRQVIDQARAIPLGAGGVSGSRREDWHNGIVVPPAVPNFTAEEENVVSRQSRVGSRLDSHSQPLLLNRIVGPDQFD